MLRLHSKLMNQKGKSKMAWILIAVVSGSLLTSTHDTKEACMGRVSTLADQKINAKCVEAPSNQMLFTGGSYKICTVDGLCR